MIQRLLLKHIQPRRPNGALLQRFHQRRLIHHLAPRNIDEDRLRPHQRKLLCANQLLGFGGKWQGQANKIGLLQQVVQAAVLRTETRLHRRLGRMAVVDHRHTKTKMPTLGQGFTDAAHADDAQGLAMHITAEMRRADVFVPLTGAHHVGQFDHTPGGGEDQRKTGVGGGFGEHVGGVAEQDAAPSQVVDVIVVDADRNAGHGLQLRRQVEQLGIQAQAGAQQAVGAGQGVAQLGQAGVIQRIDQRHLGLFMQAGHQRRREFLVQHDRLFHAVFTFNSRLGAGVRSLAPGLRKIVSTTDSSNAPLISRYEAPGEPVLLLR